MMADYMVTAPPVYSGAFDPPSAEFFAMVEPDGPGRWRPARDGGLVVLLADCLLRFDIEPDGSPGLCKRSTACYAPTRDDGAAGR